ncbi:D-3-phosphoglycerate dehydrogenase [Clostridium sp. IBUN13A]|nr:D-3-phosphoglycerate dehydrogenase [Clostridium sp. IBUN13A]KJZ88550.1 hypothetical protein ClosIBUN125C_CONTIG21g01358 [Clostridium sp. IBUN125C]KJZ93603.1 hypothetical protein ClosIBUN22A_CONTIG153g03197 [Clostridium sp. IBUN22A]
MFIAESAFGPTNLDTNIPSTIEYIAKKTIIRTVGKVILMSDSKLKFLFNEFSINTSFD